MGQFLSEANFLPDLVLTSSAARAHATVKLAGKAGKWSMPIVVKSELYGASPESVLALLRQTDEQVGRILLAGHNPTWEDLVNKLIGGGFIRFPTAAIALVKTVSESWEGLDFGSGTLIWHVTPKLLRRAKFKANF
jgi:phosphohistidine phosphatase